MVVLIIFCQKEMENLLIMIMVMIMITHTHTLTYIYIYIYMVKILLLNCFSIERMNTFKFLNNVLPRKKFFNSDNSYSSVQLLQIQIRKGLRVLKSLYT